MRLSEASLVTEIPTRNEVKPPESRHYRLSEVMGQNPVEEEKPDDNFVSASFQSLTAALDKFNAGISRMPGFAARTIYDAGAIPQDIAAALTGRNWEAKPPDWMGDNEAARIYDRAYESHSYKSKKFKGKDLGKLWSEGNFSEVGEYVYHSVIENAPISLTAIAGAYAGIPQIANLSFIGTHSATGTFIQAKEKKVGELRAMIGALVNGGLEAAFESAGSFGLFEWGKELFKTVGKQSGKAILANVVKYTSGSVLGEGFEGVGTQLTQDYSNKILGIEDIPWKSFMSRALEGGLLEAAGGLVMTAPGGISMGLREAEISNNIKSIEETLAKHYENNPDLVPLKGKTEAPPKTTEVKDFRDIASRVGEKAGDIKREIPDIQKPTSLPIDENIQREIDRPTGKKGLPDLKPTDVVSRNEVGGEIIEVTHGDVLDEAKNLHEDYLLERGGPTPIEQFLLANPIRTSPRDEATGKVPDAEENRSIPVRFKSNKMKPISNSFGAPSVPVGDFLSVRVDEAYELGLIEEPTANALRAKIAESEARGKEKTVDQFYADALRNLTRDSIAIGNEKAIASRAEARMEFDPAKLGGDSVVTIPEIVPIGSEKPQFNEEFYASLKDVKKGFFEEAKEDTSRALRQAGKLLDDIGGSLSTRLKNINPILKSALRKFEFDLLNRTESDLRGIADFMKKTRKMEALDKIAFDLARKNGDAAKIDELAKKYDLDLGKIRNILDALHTRAQEVGYDIGYLKNYYPRMIKDSAGFLEYIGKDPNSWAIIEDAITQKEASLGRFLSADEKASLINSLIRGYGSKNPLSKTGSMKERTINFIDQGLNQFYFDSDSSLIRYIQTVNEAVESRRFFGKEATHSGDPDLFLNENEVNLNNLDDSIGMYVSKLVDEKNITPDQEFELKNLLQARFGYKHTNPLIGLYKNLTYIDTLGSPISAITQLEDIGVSFYKSIIDTPGSFVKSVMSSSNIKMEDIGIDTIWEELRENRKTSKVIRWIFRNTGFAKMDKIGKETVVNSVISRYKRLAKAGNTAEIESKIGYIFGDQTQKVIEELKGNELTENIRLLAYNELLDVQPIALSEMPAAYLTSPSGRVFYTLKSFTLKRIDFIRNEAFQKIMSPDKKVKIEGVKNLFKLWALLGVFGAGVDELKDFILNRETSLSDRVVDNMLKPFGLGKWFLYKARREGIAKALLLNILPPVKFIDAVWKDVTVNLPEGKKLKIPASIPLGGKLYYWWFGKGKDISDRKKGGGRKL